MYHFLLKKSLALEPPISGEMFLNKPVMRRCILPQREKGSQKQIGNFPQRLI